MISPRSQSIIDAARMRSVSLSNPKLETLPFEELRPWQVDAAEKIVDAFGRVDCVTLDAPTGSGKTLIAEIVRRMLHERAVYCCHSIQLQHQVVGDFPESRLMKGRSNYTPISVKKVTDWSPTCADCTKEDCTLCPSLGSCPYERAKAAAAASPFAVLNTAYLLTEGNGPRVFSGRGLVIADEADTLEQEVMRYVGVAIGARRCKQYGVEQPRTVSVSTSWDDWLQSTIVRLTDAKSGVVGNDIRRRRERDYLTRLVESLRRIAPDINDGWVYTGRDDRVEFKPVRVDEHAKKYWWKLGRKFLLMSATIISPGQMLEDLGWDRDFEAVTVPSTFPVESRRVRVKPAANMTRKANEREALVRALREVLAEYPDERVLVHTVSYDLTRFLSDSLGIDRPVFTYQSSNAKDDALHGARGVRNSVILAPSFDRGVDLPDDLCRVIVVAKVPYPYLGDRQVNARLYSRGGRTWYTIQTVRSMVQMTGRGMRHKDDWCVSYVLDKQFNDLWNRSRGMFPQWWVDALDWSK